MRRSFFSFVTLTLMLLLYGAAPLVDISDEQAVIKDIQGVWVGNEHLSGSYRHVKLKFTEDGYEGWLETSESASEPEWAEQPGETGLFSLSSVLAYSNSNEKYRKIRFTILGSCCGDNSLTAWTLSNSITYNSTKGLVIGGTGNMKHK